MNYVIVTNRRNVVGDPFPSFEEALSAAERLFGGDIDTWLALNLRVEQETRPARVH